MEPDAPLAQSPRSILLAAGIIALVTVAAYGNSFSGPFVFDDVGAIVRNSTIRGLWPIWEPLCPPSHAETVSERPVLNFSLALNYALGGLDVRGYHVTNLAIHILAALLLLGIVRRTAAAVPELRCRVSPLIFAAAVSLVWAVHPLQTESVTYIVQRAESLLGLLYLLTLYCFIRATDSGRPRFWYAGSLLACLLGMATKELAATAPLVIFLYDRTFVSGSFRGAWRRHGRYYLALAATGLLLAWLLAGNTNLSQFYNEHAPYSWWSYLLTQPGVIVSYLRRACWPSGLCLYLGWMPAASVGDVLWPAMVVGGLFGVTLWALVKRPVWGFLGAWFFLILAPTSSIVPLSEPAFEHRMYLPLAAVVIAVLAGGWLLAGWLARRELVAPAVFRIAGVCLAITVVAGLAAATFRRNLDYRSEVSIWEDTLCKAPHNCRARAMYGDLLQGHGQVDAAIAQFRKILEFNPCSEAGHNRLGVALLMRGEADEAIIHFRRALEIRPDNAGRFYNSVGLAGRSKDLELVLFHNLGDALSARGHYDEAIAAYQKALEISREIAGTFDSSVGLGGHGKDMDAILFHNLGNALSMRGRFDEAIAAYQAAVELERDTGGNFDVSVGLGGCSKEIKAMLFYNLGMTLTLRGRVDEAAAAYRKALEIKPDYANARRNLEDLEAAKKEHPESLAQLRKLLQARPNDATLLNNTAWLLATSPNASVRNGTEAVELAQRAVGLSEGKRPEILGTLAAAYAEAGRFAEAVKTAGTAANLARQQGNAVMAESIESKLRLYEEGKPFREP